MKSTHRFLSARMEFTTDCHLVIVEAVGAKNVGDFGSLLFRHLFGLTFLPCSFGGEMLGVGSCGQVTAEAHCNRPGSDFGQVPL